VKITVSVDVDAPVSTVWAALEQIERHVEWMADAEEISFRTERRRGVGTEFACLTRVGPLSTVDVMTVTQWEPQRAMAVRHRGLVSGFGRFELEPVDGGRTRFTWSETVHLPPRLGGRLGEIVAGRWVLRRVWRGNLERFRRLVETGRPPDAGG